jgi:hypothetical protein
MTPMAISWAYESARMRGFFADGIYENYELGYQLEDPLVGNHPKPKKNT